MALNVNAQCSNYLSLPDSIIYSGNVVNIDAGSSYNSYQWNTGETSQVITADVTGYYSVIVKQNTSHGNKCTYYDTVFVSIINNQIQQSDTSVCANSPVYLSINTKSCKKPFAYYPLDGNANDESVNGMNDGINIPIPRAMIASGYAYTALLYNETKIIIGTKNGWDDFLKMKGVRLRGHQVAQIK